MKRLVAILCLTFILVGTMTSCMGPSMKNFFKDFEYEAEPELKSLTALSQLEGYSYSSSYGNIVRLNDYKNSLTKFYNAKTDSIILSVTSNKLEYSDVFTVNDYEFVRIVEEDEDGNSKTKIYDSLGTLVANKTGYDSNYIRYDLDLFSLNGTVYRVEENGKASVVTENPFFGDLPYFSAKTENYYYYISGYSVRVYDYSLETVYYWETPHREIKNCFINVI